MRLVRSASFLLLGLGVLLMIGVEELAGSGKVV